MLTRLVVGGNLRVAAARSYASIEARSSIVSVAPNASLQKARSWDEGISSNFSTTPLYDIFKGKKVAIFGLPVSGMPALCIPIREDRALLNGAQKLLGILIAVGEVVAYVLSGMYGSVGQLGVGNAIVICLDELLQKGYGFLKASDYHLIIGGQLYMYGNVLLTRISGHVRLYGVRQAIHSHNRLWDRIAQNDKTYHNGIRWRRILVFSRETNLAILMARLSPETTTIMTNADTGLICIDEQVTKDIQLIEAIAENKARPDISNLESKLSEHSKNIQRSSLLFHKMLMTWLQRFLEQI